MKKSYIVEDLCCAHCASKIEEAVRAIPGVNEASVSFITQKMVVDSDFDQDKKFFKKLKKLVESYEPEASLIEE